MDRETSLLKVSKEIEMIASLGYKDMVSHLPRDRMSIGFFCPFVPEELIHAAGALPFRLMGTPVRISHVPAHLPPIAAIWSNHPLKACSRENSIS